ncbi:hypothetical protein [Chryseobacterium scophthalmum]|uniref:hypothetical protein n=1 Tax=Chryseobacterium scophthalmum TaxID=59733 RepID=UPI000C9DCA05|nr:hypothetical protein [Chryseobacterium scophthalmum]
MQSNEKLTQIKNGLPYGGIKELINRTGLCRLTINNILSGKKAVMQNVSKVIIEGEKIISEYQELTGQKPK